MSCILLLLLDSRLWLEAHCTFPACQVRFYYSFASRDNLYIVMEYVAGGDCYSLLRSLGALDEGIARTYIAETVLALEYCHTQVGAVAACICQAPDGVSFGAG